MKKESKVKRPQMLLSIQPGFKERMDKLGAKVGMTGNQFVVEGLDRFAEIIVDFLDEERQALASLHEKQRERLLEMGRLARSQKDGGHRK